MKILLTQLNFPEGPCFDRNGILWLVEKDAGNLVSLDGETYQRHYVGGAPNGIAVDKNNLLWFCDSANNSIRTFNPRRSTTNNIIENIDGQKLKMPNDLTFNSQGNLFFTCPGSELNDGTGYICYYEPNNGLKKIAAEMFYPNGLAFNKAETQLYVAETGTQKIWTFDWNNETKALSNRRLLAETGGSIGPDGIAFDEDENLYVAVYGSGQVKVWNNLGQQINAFETDGNNPTNCAIDPTRKKGLVITEAEKGLLIHYPLNKKGTL
jgi:gluconolactonase